MKIQKIIVLSFAISSSQAFAAYSYLCKNNGNTVDMERSQIRDTIDGDVSCVRDWGNKKQTEKYTYSKGHKLVEEIESDSQHIITHYDPTKENVRTGDQIEYFPGTHQIHIKGALKANQNIGLKEEFYPNGKISQRTIYGPNEKGQDGYEQSSIGYTPSGKIRFARCSSKKSTTIDSKLCGFEGPSDVTFYNPNEELRSKVRIVDGKQVNIEEKAKVTSEWDTVLNAGFVKDPPADKRQKAIASDGSTKITDLYADGNTKRIMNTDAKGRITGLDEEWYDTGGKARSTKYSRSGADSIILMVNESTCWWENGSPKAEVKKLNDQYSTKFYWDNKKLALEGKFENDPDAFYWRVNDVEELISCEPNSFGLIRVGPHTSYNYKGGLLQEANYSKGKLSGLQKNYEPDGEPKKELLSLEADYKDDKMTHAKYYKDGKLQREESYFADGSIKETKAQ